MQKTYVLDTNVLIQSPEALEAFEDNHIVLPLAVLEELDGLKNAEGEKGRSARQVIRFLEELRSQGSLVEGVSLPGGGTLRLGSYPCVLDKASRACALYGQETIHERHRHRYEVNNDYRKALTDHGMALSGLSPDNRIVEMIELPSHPWFVATQAHPEFKSRPNRPHPLFKGFVEAALMRQKQDAVR